MEITDLIQLFAIITSLIVSVVAILQTRKSIKMTEESIRDANRPYLSIYVETIEISSFSKYFVIKNFGVTSAKILDLSFSRELDSSNKKFNMNSLINGTLAPGQKLTSFMDPKYKETVDVTITYSDLQGKIYKETSSIKTDMHSHLLWNTSKKSTDTKEATAIKQSAQAIIKAMK
ncbi:hypothetical protein [Enterococcus sp. AZ072]|uniref:hypothetical protein n=1 Tax=unclassified Enterococcus TaxID=2608891 RepID=UPI003D26CFC7